jgi:phosphotransferase system  glucose/maltose/N-acetylglucosamine-specific IIC component
LGFLFFSFKKKSLSALLIFVSGAVQVVVFCFLAAILVAGWLRNNPQAEF